MDSAPWQCTLSHLPRSATLCWRRTEPSPSHHIPGNTLLAKNRTITQPPHSPDLAGWDFCLFPRMNMELRWHCFASVEEIQQNTSAEIKPCKKRTFRSASSNDRTAEASVYMQKFSISMLTELFFTYPFYEKLCPNFGNVSILLYRIRCNFLCLSAPCKNRKIDICSDGDKGGSCTIRSNEVQVMEKKLFFATHLTTPRSGNLKGALQTGRFCMYQIGILWTFK
jgi:hypothetical protein